MMGPDLNAYDDERAAEMTPQAFYFEPEPTQRSGEHCRWCWRHYTRHDPLTMECPGCGRHNKEN